MKIAVKSMSQLFSWSGQGQQNRLNGWRKIFLSLLCWGLSGATACGWTEDQRIGWESSLCPFVAQADISAIKARLAQGADPNGFCDYTYGGQYLIGQGMISQPLLWAALRQENSQVAELLIQAGADVNAPSNLKSPHDQTYTPLYFAVEQGNSKLVKLMLDKGAKVNVGIPSLMAAIRKQRLDLVQMLLAAGANPNADAYGLVGGSKVLHELIKQDEAFFQAAATALLAHGADINLKGEWGNQPLYYTVNQSNFESGIKKAQFLLDHGAKIDAQNSQGVSPLLAAASTNLKYSPQLVRFLVARGAKVNLSDRDGNTALHYLAGSANPEAPALIKLMIERGVDVNAQNDRGNTALHNLADNQQQPVQKAEILIAHGAKTNLQNQQAETPLSLAQAQGNTELIQFLQSRSSSVRQGQSPR
jgi:uncharacterized protein